MPITVINKAVCKTLRMDLEDALVALAEVHGISITIGNASFNSQNVKFKLECAIKDGDMAMTQERTDFLALAEQYGLKPEHLDMVIVDSLRDTPYKIIGLKPRSHRYPILMLNMETGKSFKFTATMVAGFVQNKLEQEAKQEIKEESIVS